MCIFKYTNICIYISPVHYKLFKYSLVFQNRGGWLWNYLSNFIKEENTRQDKDVQAFFCLQNLKKGKN